MNGISSQVSRSSCPEGISGSSAELLRSPHSLRTDTVLVFLRSPAFPRYVQDHHSRPEISSAKSLRIVLHKWSHPAKLNMLTPRGLI